MKKYFQVLGMITLICFSFYYTEKTATAIKEVDSIMIDIKKGSQENKVEAIDSLVIDDSIIPGLYGSIVDVKKSYKKMRRIGKYNTNYLIFDEVKPKNSIEQNFDKYIIKGNDKKNMVSLLFVVKNSDNIDTIIEILNSRKVKANFFVDGNWFENNNDLLLKLISEGHVIGNMSYNLDYNDSGFIWMNTILKKIGRQRINYCYTEVSNENTLKNCSLQKNFTIKPNIIVKNNPTIEIKNSITPGSIISLPVNDNVINELPVIIDYIKSRGYKIENLNNHLSERK